MAKGEKCLVEKDALVELLRALAGPPHLIRELVAIRNLPGTPLMILVEDLGNHCKAQREKTTIAGELS